MLETEPPAEPAKVEEAVYIYRLDPELYLPVVIGKVYKDPDGMVWVRLDSNELAAGVGAEAIQGTMLLSSTEFNAFEPE